MSFWLHIFRNNLFNSKIAMKKKKINYMEIRKYGIHPNIELNWPILNDNFLKQKL